MLTCLSEEGTVKHQGLGGLFVAGTVLLATQPVWAQATQVTNVQLNPTTGGMELILKTANGERPQIFTVNRPNAFVADITNTQLRLPQGNSFRQDNPAPGIASIVVTQMDANSVRLVVSGVNNAPKGEIARAAQGITFSFAPSAGGATPTASNPSNRVVQLPTPTAQAPAVQTPTAQTPGGRTPDVLVPNPQITIEGGPAPAAGAVQPVNPAPPFLPRAVPPAVGDISIAELDPSGSTIDLNTGERVPRLLLRDAPVREVLSLLARAAGLNVVFVGPQAGAPGQQGQQAQQGAQGQGQPGAASLDATISLDIENEPIQDVFNYVLRITGLEANRSGRTIFVGTRLPDVARNVVVRSLRLNQVPVTTAANFLTAQGAETQLPIERVQIQTIGEGAAARTIEIREPDIKVLRAQRGEGPLVLSGLSVLTNERLNTITLVGDPRKVEIASSFLTQLDARRRQVAVNVKIIDVNLLNTDFAGGSFSFGVGRSFFTFDQGAAAINFGGVNPPTVGDVTGSVLSPAIIPTSPRVIPGTTVEPFLDAQPAAPFGTGNPQSFGSPPLNDGRIQFPPSGIFVRPPFGTDRNPLQGGATQIQQGNIEFGLPQLFQFPSRFLSLLQAQITNGNAKILTDPTLVIQEGERATVNLGQEVITNIFTEREITNGVPVATRRAQKDIAGLRLEVQVNRIDDNGFITLLVNPTVTVPGTTATIDDQQITLLARRDLVSGQIRLRDGQTLILSGIIQDQDRSEVRKVPILGDIPILGALFRRTTRNNARQEVVVLLTPQIMDDASGAQFGYRYRPGPEVQQLLQQRGVPGSINNR
jgi:type IV pilus assembly protein PilQ